MNRPRDRKRMLNQTISVVVPCHNAAPFLRKTLDSLVNQTCQPREVIVVDDGSTDESAAITRFYGTPVRVIRQENQGAGATRMAWTSVAVRSMFSLLNDGGHIALTFPYNEHRYIPDVYRLDGAGYGKDFMYIGQVFSREQILQWVEMNGATIVDQEYWQVFTGPLWTFGQRIEKPVSVGPEEVHHLSCILMQKGAVSATEVNEEG